MSDEKIINSNLESIDGGDLDLAKKFGHVEKNNSQSGENKKEAIIVASEKEKNVEMGKVEKDSTYNQIVSKISKTTNDVTTDDVKNDAQMVSEKMDAESQIQHLVEIATSKGVTHAIKVAKHIDDNYVMDMLHDKLISDEFHKVLVEKNFISPE